jgi:hypothetical protein
MVVGNVGEVGTIIQVVYKVIATTVEHKITNYYTTQLRKVVILKHVELKMFLHNISL